MTEEKPETTEQERKQVSTTDSIKILIRSSKLAKTATGYTAATAKRPGGIFFNDGNDRTTDPTLSAYIDRAEVGILEKYKAEVIAEAGRLIDAELEAVRELLK